MVQIISFDIGIRNFAYCIIQHTNNKTEIQYIDNLDLLCRKNDSQKIIDRTIDILDDIFQTKLDLNDSIIVLIESQMTSCMRAIQTVINVFFKLNARYQSLDIKTRYLSPKHKLNLIDKFKNEYDRPSQTASNQYKQNKLDSVLFGEWLLTHKYINDPILKKIKTFKKQDDLWDTLNMCIYYVECEASQSK